MSSNYPPGVTGNEWEIAGFPLCGHADCGHPDEDHEEPVDGYHNSGACEICSCKSYTPYPDEPDDL